MTALTTEDIAAAREQGDLKALLRMAAGLTSASPEEKHGETAQVPYPPRSRPGAWPDGTHSPGPVPAVAAILARHWPERYATTQSEPPKETR